MGGWLISVLGVCVTYTCSGRATPLAPGVIQLCPGSDWGVTMGLLTSTKLNDNLTTIPEPVRNYLELESGDRVEWHVEEAQIIVKKQVED